MIEISFSKIFYMFQMLPKNLSLFISLRKITMLSLNFTLGIFFLRIGTRASLYFMKMVSTLLPWQHGLQNLQINLLLQQSNPAWCAGTIV
jgi:hypothetical protein